MSEATYFQTHQQTTLWIPTEVKERFQTLCKAEGISMNKRVISLIAQYLDEQEALDEMEAQEEVVV